MAEETGRKGDQSPAAHLVRTTTVHATGQMFRFEPERVRKQQGEWPTHKVPVKSGRTRPGKMGGGTGKRTRWAQIERVEQMGAN